MNHTAKTIIYFPLFLFAFFSYGQSEKQPEFKIQDLSQLEQSLSYYPVVPQAEVMVVGTFHFNNAVLTESNQKSLKQLIKKLAAYQPTKVVLELEPSQNEEINTSYAAFKNDSLDISKSYNEVYQMGFRIAKTLDHERLYLFDNQTDFIGSLQAFREGDDPFSFEKFSVYALSNDDGFYNRYEKELIKTFDDNQKILNDFAPYERIALMNSVKAQEINAQRMHMYELRVGIQKNWVGADWVGRFYQRNLRMAANVLKMMREGDRILIIVGDNHKWALDEMFTKIPDIDLTSSWDFLKERD